MKNLHIISTILLGAVLVIRLNEVLKERYELTEEEKRKLRASQVKPI